MKRRLVLGVLAGLAFHSPAGAQPAEAPPAEEAVPEKQAEPPPAPTPEPEAKPAPEQPKAAPAELEDKPSALPKAAAPTLVYPRSSFSFGSYGRVVVSSDGRGGEGRNADVVAYGSRIDESTYAELELRRDDEWRKDVSSRVVTTLAIGGPLFHYDGRFDAQVAVRNLYVEERGIGDKGLSAWAARACTAATTSTCSTSGRSTT